MPLYKGIIAAVMWGTDLSKLSNTSSQKFLRIARMHTVPIRREDHHCSSLKWIHNADSRLTEMRVIYFHSKINASKFTLKMDFI